MCTVSVIFAVVTTILTALCIYNTDAYAEESVSEESSMQEAVQTVPEGSGSLLIPLPQTLDESNVHVDFSCENKLIKITISGVSSSFYYENPLQGDVQHVAGFLYGQDDASAVLEMQLNDFVVCNYDIEESFLIINIKPMSEVYEHIVVVDAAHFNDIEDIGTKMYGIKECEVNYLAAQQLKEALMKKGIGVLLTRPEEQLPAEESERLRLCEESNADMLIQLACSADENTRVTHGVRVKYTDNARELADILYEKTAAEGEKEILTSTLGKAGLPTVRVSLGYLTNKSDAVKLGEAVNLGSLAEKIAEGAEEYYGK